MLCGHTRCDADAAAGVFKQLLHQCWKPLPTLRDCYFFLLDSQSTKEWLGDVTFFGDVNPAHVGWFGDWKGFLEEFQGKDEVIFKKIDSISSFQR